MKKLLLPLAAAGMLTALAVAPQSANAVDIKIGFIPGVVDPFYQVMQLGVEKAAKDLGVEVVTQIPPTWGVEAQAPILDAMVARGDLNYIIIAAVDSNQMVAPLQAAFDAGIKIVGVDTFIGNGDYANGPVTFPMTYIGSDNMEGGRISGRALGKAIGGKGTVYINSVSPNISSVEQRVNGFKEVMAKEFPEHQGGRARLQRGRPQQGLATDGGGDRAEPGSRGRVRQQRLQRARGWRRRRECRSRRPCPGRRL